MAGNLKGANLFYIFSDAIRSIRENLATTVLTAVTLGFSLSIFAVFVFVFFNLRSVINSWGDRTQIVAYVKDSSDAAAMRDAIMRVPGVSSAEFVSKEKALSELKAELKGHEAILEGVDENPLPATFEIRVAGSYRDPAELTAVAERLKAIPWVEDVQYSREWVEKLSAFFRFVELAAAFIGVFLAGATIFIISNTIRLTVYARREEIEIMTLVGASDSFIRVPFFIEGVLQGLIGGIFALLILAGGRLLLLSKIPPYFSFVVSSPVPVPLLALILITTGVVMGVAGCLISMGRFLKV
ncbi:MAG: ABC transporter permease [Deltaproteobacteria bacterium]|nr:ABC transporter permease [Deltaproteobacteria bacterium]